MQERRRAHTGKLNTEYEYGHFMLKIYTPILIMTGLLVITCGLIFNPMKASAGKQKVKAKKLIPVILEYITNRKFIKKILDILARDKNFILNKLESRVLENSDSGIDLQQLYFFKILCFVLCILLTMLIGYTNTINKTKLIVAYSDERQALYQSEPYDESKYQLYSIVLAGVGEKKLLASIDTEKYSLVEFKIAEYLNISDEKILKEKTEWFLKVWTEVQNMCCLNYYFYVLIAVPALFLPELLLTVRWLLRRCIYKKEIIKLEYIFELLARVDGVKTIDIINQLEKSSKIYSKYLHMFAAIFQYDKKSAFAYLKDRNIKSLSRMAGILEIYSLSDKEVAIQILDREVMERDEQMLLTAEESIDIIDLTAFLSIVPLVYELARLMLDPMLDIVYRAFEFI
ncbi:hypothetical protein LY28_00960 [Ruminiclostridium sufflavum DSM 19573]|uniref:Uncharacterized protein n=1 Tax=Ruminiclostridium sufflavum DSM 19573 TaxID=1121337 RepID=A0A318XMQ2_9FIRM|nr:hypothetical protein [Ruminiclostridium sufflavum]PYG89137.1 hypothetical protein LY28_00960 [Ruminiclostridium sufflavum DSM 19573]